MNSLPYKAVAIVIAAILAVFMYLDLSDASKTIDGFQFFLKLITTLGFAVACFALLLGGRITLLNNATMLLLGLPSLIMVGVSLWAYIDGTLSFKVHQLIPLGIYSFGIIISGSIANEAQTREEATDQGLS